METGRVLPSSHIHAVKQSATLLETKLCLPTRIDILFVSVRLTFIFVFLPCLHTALLWQSDCSVS